MSASKDLHNRRRFDRYRVRIPCRIVAEGEEHWGIVTNVSADGVFLDSRAELASGVKVVLTLESSKATSNESLVLTGHVARKRRSHLRVEVVVSPAIAVQLESAPEAFFSLLADLDRAR